VGFLDWLGFGATPTVGIQSILAPTGIASSVAYGFAFNGFGTATTWP